MANYMDGMEDGKHNSDNAEGSFNARTKKPIYRTIVQIVILSDEKYDTNKSLSDINYDITDGDCSGQTTIKVENKVLLGRSAAKQIEIQGSDPEFFGIDENGYEVE